MSKAYRDFKAMWKHMNNDTGLHPSKFNMVRFRECIHDDDKFWKRYHDGTTPYHTSRLARKQRLTGTGWVRYNNGFWDYLNSGVVVGHVMFRNGEWEAYRVAPVLLDDFYMETFFRKYKTRAEVMRFVEGKE